MSRSDNIKKHNAFFESQMSTTKQLQQKLAREKHMLDGIISATEHELPRHITHIGKTNGVNFYVTSAEGAQSDVAPNFNERQLMVNINGRESYEAFEQHLKSEGLKVVKQKDVPYRYNDFKNNQRMATYRLYRVEKDGKTFDVIKANQIIDTYRPVDNIRQDQQFPGYLGFIEAVNNKINMKSLNEKKAYQEVLFNCGKGYSRSVVAAAITKLAQEGKFEEKESNDLLLNGIKATVEQRHSKVFVDGFTKLDTEHGPSISNLCQVSPEDSEGRQSCRNALLETAQKVRNRTSKFQDATIAFENFNRTTYKDGEEKRKALYDMSAKYTEANVVGLSMKAWLSSVKQDWKELEQRSALLKSKISKVSERVDEAEKALAGVKEIHAQKPERAAHRENQACLKKQEEEIERMKQKREGYEAKLLENEARMEKYLNIFKKNAAKNNVTSSLVRDIPSTKLEMLTPQEQKYVAERMLAFINNPNREQGNGR